MVRRPWGRLFGTAPAAPPPETAPESAPAEVAPAPAAPLPLEIDFCQGGNREGWLGRGWGPAERHGSWSIAEHATLILPGLEDPPGCELALRVRPHLAPPACAFQDLLVYADEVHVLTRRLTGPQTVRLRLPQGAVEPRTPFTLRLRCPGAVSPRRLGTGGDERRLGIALVSLSLVHAAAG